MLTDNTAIALAIACAAIAGHVHRKLNAAKHSLLRELFARIADEAEAEPEAVLVVQPGDVAEPDWVRLVQTMPQSWYVVVAGPPWLAVIKEAAWGRPVGAMRVLSPGRGALREGTYLAIRRGERFELVHEVRMYLQRRGSTWSQVGDQSPSAAADDAGRRLLQ